MLYLPFKQPRRDLIFPRGSGGNFIMYMLSYDTYGNNMNHDSGDNEYFFDHTHKFRDNILKNNFFEFVQVNKDKIISANSSWKNLHKYRKGVVSIFVDTWIYQSFKELTELSIDELGWLDFSIYCRIPWHNIDNSVMLSTTLHNDIISNYSNKNYKYLTCARHTPDTMAFYGARPFNSENKFLNHLQNGMNYEFGFIDFDFNSDAFKYVVLLRYGKHLSVAPSHVLNYLKTSLHDVFSKEVAKVKALFPNHTSFKWEELFFDKNTDTWERLFEYYDRKSVWDTYKSEIMEHVNHYMYENDKLYEKMKIELDIL